MHSPAELVVKLRSQWLNADLREQRLLAPARWPVCLPIGRPSAVEFAHHNTTVQQHIQRWRAVEIGQVVWESVRYRSAGGEIPVPVRWELSRPSEWIAAIADPELTAEYHRLSHLITATDPQFHRLLLRQRGLILSRPEHEIVTAAQLALALHPGIAQGRPLRALAFHGIDSKFLERNRQLVCRMLDTRFDGQASEQGLEGFLGAYDQSEHWLLVVPLAPDLLPFEQLRIRSSELATTALPGSHLLIIENERCRHQLPQLGGTVAVLGAGLDLAWLQASWLARKQLAYWGDIDTWGLAMLAQARTRQPGLQALLMTRSLFDTHAKMSAVPELTPFGETPPIGLSADEQALYRYLLELPKGRLEQEFIATEQVQRLVWQWWKSTR